MSKFLDDSRALIETIATGAADDAATKAAVEELKTKLEENTVSDEEVKTVITEILGKLQASTPVTPGEDTVSE